MLTSMHISVDGASSCDGPKMHIPKMKMSCISLIVNCFVITCIQLNKANSSDIEAPIVLCFVVRYFMSIPVLQSS